MAQATPVRVNSVQATAKVNWQIGSPLERRLIKSVVMGPDDRPAFPAYVELQADGYDHNADLQSTAKDGRASLEALVGIKYFVQARGARGEAWHCHRIPVRPGDEVLTIKLNRPGTDCDECRTKR